MKNFTLIFLLFLSFLPQESLSQELIAKYHDWNVFRTERGDKVVCYLASTPIKHEGNYVRRGEPYFLVTDITNDADEVTVSSGFVYSKKTDIEVSFGSKKFYLFPYTSLAWANSKSNDIDIIKEMQQAEEIIVSGVANNGKIATDTYSLIGFVKAYSRMREACE